MEDLFPVIILYDNEDFQNKIHVTVMDCGYFKRKALLDVGKRNVGLEASGDPKSP